jgi:hypothetical protein
MLWTIPLATTLASSAYDWWTSYQQGKRADAMQKNNVRPNLGIPESEQRSLASAENQAKMTRLPGQSAIEGRLDQTTANQVAMVERQGIGGATSINAASTAYGNQQQKENELGIASANMQLNNQQILRDELDENAGWQQKAWDWNVGDPYMSKQTAIASLREAQLRNRNTAFKNLVGGLGNTAMMGMMGDDGEMGGGDGWFDAMAKSGRAPSKKVVNSDGNTYFKFNEEDPNAPSTIMGLAYSKYDVDEKYNQQKGSQSRNKSIYDKMYYTPQTEQATGEQQLQPNYTDKFFQNWASGGRGK